MKFFSGDQTGGRRKTSTGEPWEVDLPSGLDATRKAGDAKRHLLATRPWMGVRAHPELNLHAGARPVVHPFHAGSEASGPIGGGRYDPTASSSRTPATSKVSPGCSGDPSAPTGAPLILGGWSPSTGTRAKPSAVLRTTAT